MNRHEQKAFEQLKTTLEFADADLTTALYNADIRIRRLQASETEAKLFIVNEFGMDADAVSEPLLDVVKASAEIYNDNMGGG